MYSINNNNNILQTFGKNDSNYVYEEPKFKKVVDFSTLFKQLESENLSTCPSNEKSGNGSSTKKETLFCSSKKKDENLPFVEDICSTGQFGRKEENDLYNKENERPHINIFTNDNFNSKENYFGNFSKENKNFDTMTKISFADLVKNVNLSNNPNNFDFSSKNQKKKILSSEEILLNKIKKEKEELKKQKKINNNYFEKAIKKTIREKPIAPTPLTLLDPFNLSNGNMLNKKRVVQDTSSDNELTMLSSMLKTKCSVKDKENHNILNTSLTLNESMDSKIKRDRTDTYAILASRKTCSIRGNFTKYVMF